MTIELDHFELSEFDCKCGDCERWGSYMSESVLRKLDLARERAGYPFVITSGMRCKDRNRDEGGKTNSAHLHGLASDIACTNARMRFDMLQALLGVGFHRIGIGPTWIHVDDDDSKPAECCWTY